MIFNFSKKHQFITNLKIENDIVEVVSETKLLGTYITSDLKWDKNTSELVKKAYKRMQILYKAANVTTKKNDLKRIYKTFIRSILDHSAVVWHSGLTQKNRQALERVQKTAVKVIMGGQYINYKDALKILNLEDLDKRRENLCLKFAKSCLKTEKVKGLFPRQESNHRMLKRKNRPFKEKLIKTKRYKRSAVPYMTELLNKEAEKKNLIMNNW